MADDFIQVAPDSTGKKVDNTTETTGAGTVERQRVSVAGVGGNNQLSIDAAGKVGINNFPATQPVSAVALPLPTGASTEATLGGVLKEGTDITGAAMPAGGASGRGWLSAIWKLLNGGLPAALGTGGGLKVDGSGTALPISAASLPLPIGAAQDATLTGGTTKAIVRGGAKGTTAAADLTSNPIDANTQALHVDGSKVTQPVSGTFWQATQPVSNAAASQADGHSASIGTTTDASTANTVIGRLKQLVTLLAGGLPAALAASGGLKVDIAGTGANATAIKVDGSGVTQPVSGTVTANQGTANATPWNDNLARVGGVAVATDPAIAGAQLVSTHVRGTTWKGGIIGVAAAISIIQPATVGVQWFLSAIQFNFTVLGAQLQILDGATVIWDSGVAGLTVPGLYMFSWHDEDSLGNAAPNTALTVTLTPAATETVCALNVQGWS